MILCGKYEVLKGEKAGLAVGLDVHFPSSSCFWWEATTLFIDFRTEKE